MPLEPFDQICPAIACAELRVCTVPIPELGVPTGDYFLREFYCTEPGCDCRRVLIQFLPKDGPAQPAATINFGWEKAKYYRKWSSDPDLWREMAGATLERFAEQGPHKANFLVIFKHIIQDRTLVAAFRRHYRLVKDLIEGETSFDRR
ncbi:MAG: hypothetical protein KGS61_18360 [Verrucomicrobia bacterium]|nr:hypothetical protein [Verrucomicrobiota bacterium]